MAGRQLRFGGGPLYFDKLDQVTSRWLTADQFRDLARDRVIECSPGLVRHLEGTGWLRPVARVRFPPDLVVDVANFRDRTGHLSVTASENYNDSPSRRAADSLWAALHDAGDGWNRSEDWRHPLDEPQGRWWPLILTDEQTPLDPGYWMCPVTWRDDVGEERRSDEGSRAYFHGWQILLLAEAERARIEIYPTEQFRTAFWARSLEPLMDLKGSCAARQSGWLPASIRMSGAGVSRRLGVARP